MSNTGTIPFDRRLRARAGGRPKRASELAAYENAERTAHPKPSGWKARATWVRGVTERRFPTAVGKAGGFETQREQKSESECVTEATKGARLRPLKSEVEVEEASCDEQG